LPCVALTIDFNNAECGNEINVPLCVLGPILEAVGLLSGFVVDSILTVSRSTIYVVLLVEVSYRINLLFPVRLAPKVDNGRDAAAPMKMLLVKGEKSIPPIR